MDPLVDHFAMGLALFNRGCFFECHEEWEEAWKRSSGEERSFYQGLIQAAVALYHARRGNLRGAASTYAKARAKLDALPDNYMRFALDKFREDLDAYIAAAMTGTLPPEPPKLTVGAR